MTVNVQPWWYGMLTDREKITFSPNLLHQSVLHDNNLALDTIFSIL